MKTWHDRLDLAMKSRGKKWAELVKITRLSKPSVYAWRPDAKKRTEMMNGDNAAIVCEWLGISSKWLFEGVGDSGLDLCCSEINVVAADDETPIASTTTKNEHQGVSQSLLTEISAREIPPHIEQAMMTLLQTCPPKERKSAQQPNEQVLEAARKLTNIVDAMPPDQQAIFEVVRQAIARGESVFGFGGDVQIFGAVGRAQADDDQAAGGE